MKKWDDLENRFEGDETIYGTVSLASKQERSERLGQVNRMKNTLIPNDEILMNLSLYQRRQDLSHVLFMNLLYQQILGIHGIIIEFGVRWGRNLALLQNLRGIYEPYNYTRKIVGFDTFEGFPGVSDQDGMRLNQGNYSIDKKHLRDLHEILQYHESESPLSHISKYELIQGNVIETLPVYLENHPETIVAMAYMDLDLYEPTKAVLDLIKDRMPKGAILGFDELNHTICPGETKAYNEILGIANRMLCRNPMNPCQSWVII